MTAHANRVDTASFMARLLTPVPPEAEQPDAPAFHRELIADLKDVWSLQKMLVDATAAERQAAGIREAYDWKRGIYAPPACVSLDQSHEPHFVECDKLMRIPAPTIGALRWKEATRGYNGGLPEWEAMIASDQARLLRPREARQ